MGLYLQRQSNEVLSSIKARSIVVYGPDNAMPYIWRDVQAN